jgi:FKBP-type peptidyl-prolyl cis-trans isomerase SlyD
MSDSIVAKNKAIYITYSILDQKGQVVEHSDVPIGYVHGADSGIFEQVEAALEGAKPGDKFEVMLSPDEGFGAHDPALTFTDEIENVPPEYHYLGAEVEFENAQGEAMKFRVTKIENGKLTIDANHPFAGQTVKFAVTVVAVRDATPEEIANGRPDEGGPPTLH